jgi:tetratricopeptide (TPR) repeat protein/transcriptional regulator with XRE-family HTH domain
MVKKAAQAIPNRLLRAARKERNWTQKEVADAIGSPQSFNVSRWEQGTAIPSAHYIQQLCLLFGKSARELGLLQEEPTASASSESFTEADSSSLWTVPYRRNFFFTDREEVLTQLHNRLTASGTAALTQTQAISGLGGIGKTQIAVEYAFRHRELYHMVLWVRAASRDALISDFVTLASLLHLHGQDEQDQNKVVGVVKRWLASRGGWLLILDNADDLDLVVDFLPTGDKGHILLTTRAQATGGIAPSIAVEKMEQNEGIRLLLCRAKLLAPGNPIDLVSEQERTQAQGIVKAMDGLPLAIDQAGAYIEETGCGLANYLELYRTHRQDLLLRRGTLSSEHPESVASTWALSFLQVEQSNLAAADLLRLCGFLDPDAIPEEILTEGASLLGSILGPVASDPLQLNAAIQVLRRYSLIKRNIEAKLLSVHRLVQAVLKDGMDDQLQRQWAERAIRVVSHIFPISAEYANWSLCQRYIVHAQTCATLIEQWNVVFVEAAQLLNRAGYYLFYWARYTEAESLLQLALVVEEKTLGPDHVDVAQTLNYLGELYTEWGMYFQAELLLQRARAIQEQALGPDHVDVAQTLNNLAQLFWILSRYRQTEELLERILDIRERALGPDHLEVSQSLNNLAVLYNDQGKYEQAEPLYRRALAIREHALEANDPRLAMSFHNLGTLYRDQGKYPQAETLCRRAFAIREQVLGPEHPLVANSFNALALIYYQQGWYSQSEPLFQRALAIQEKMLAPESLETAKSCYFLARLYQIQARYKEGKLLYQRALAIREKVLGPEHPETVKIRESYRSLLK